MTKLIQTKSINWIVVLLVAFLVSEAFYKYLLDLHLKEYRISGLIKFIAQIPMVYVILINHKKHKKPLKLLLLLAFLFMVSQITLSNYNLYLNIESFNNSIFIIIMLLFADSLTLNKKQINQIFKWFEIVIIINSIAVIIGFIFSIAYFKTYHGIRFGYSGFLIKSSYASYFSLISLFYFAHQAFILNKSKKLLFLLVAISAIIVGTKASILALLLCCLLLIYKNKLFLNKYFVLLLSSLLILNIIFQEKILISITPYIDLFFPIIEEHGIFTALFSYRNLILQESLIPFIQSDWSFINYLIGGLGSILIKSGFDFIDIFYFFGILGGSLYIYILYLVLYISKAPKDYICFILFTVIIMALAGNFFYNSSIAILMCIIKLYFQSIKEYES
ncbi:MAG: hypothetical protein ACPG6B_08390 [Oceanihabitans sp.]